MEARPIANRLPAKAMDATVERLEHLFDTHYDRLYRFARRLVPSMDDALDLVQDTFLRAARSLNSIPTGSISAQEAWLMRVLINVRKDEWRKAKVRVRHASREQAHGELRNARNPEHALIARATVWNAL